MQGLKQHPVDILFKHATGKASPTAFMLRRSKLRSFEHNATPIHLAHSITNPLDTDRVCFWNPTMPPL